jgi:hypothetical protein
MQLQRHLGERTRQAAVRIEGRLQIPARHADVVLLGAQADLLVGHHGPEAAVAPVARQLAADPGVRCLSDRDHPPLVTA